MGDEQVRQLLCLLNHYACLCLLLLPAYLQIDRNFSQGGTRQAFLLQLCLSCIQVHNISVKKCPCFMHTPADAAQQYATRIIKMLLSNTPYSLSSPLSPHQTPNGAQLPLQPFLESYAATLALLQSHSSIYCTP